jgi:hypothetical protein
MEQDQYLQKQNQTKIIFIHRQRFNELFLGKNQPASLSSFDHRFLLNSFIVKRRIGYEQNTLKGIFLRC